MSRSAVDCIVAVRHFEPSKDVARVHEASLLASLTGGLESKLVLSVSSQVGLARLCHFVAIGLPIPSSPGSVGRVDGGLALSWRRFIWRTTSSKSVHARPSPAI